MNSLIEVFHIDWKLLVAQAVNFAVVFSALYFFILKPLFKTMKERAEKIEKGLKDSEQFDNDLKELQEKRGHILSEAQKKADLEIESAKKIAGEKQKKIIDDAEAKAQEMAMMARAQAEVEKQKIVDSSRREVLDLAFAVVQNVLGKKVGEKEDEEFTKKFIKNI